jgi:osmotically-inducible protein OsmY
MKFSRKLLAVALSSIVCAGAMAQDRNPQADRGFEGSARDAWITGKIETVMLLNTELNSFEIDTDVNNGMVVLSGDVESQIDKDLAAELARGIDGVSDVQNNLNVTPENFQRNTSVAANRTDADDHDYDYDYDYDHERGELAQWFSDRTTTAVVKSRLLANDSTEGLQIGVDTSRNIVTLTGDVKSESEKTLAEEIARNSRDVADVQNNLTVNPSA